MTKVSIGIPFYNAEDFLRDAITSALNQRFDDFELLLIDDGSTDNSLQIARNFANKRIRLFADGANKGLPARLNELVAHARGEYFARMDADDIMFSRRIATQVRFLEQHPEVDVLGSGVITIDTRNGITGTINYPEHPGSTADVVRHRCFIHPSIMAKRSWFVQNAYDEHAERMEDYELWLRTIAQSHFCNLAEPLLFYRVSGLPYLQKYLRSMAGERRVLRQHRDSIAQYRRIVLKNYLKCGLYTAFSALHLTDVLLQMRSQKLHNPTLLQHAQQALQEAIKPCGHTNH